MLDTKTRVKLACCIALAFGTAVVAAQQTGASAGRERGDLDKIRKVSTLIGTHVVNRAKMTVAEVRDLVVSPEGAVKFAVLGFGGVAGVGESYTAAPFDVMDIRQDDGKWSVNLEMPAEEFKKAPLIRSEDYGELTDPQWIARVDQFFTPRSESENKERPGDAGSTTRDHRAVIHVILASKVRARSPRMRRTRSSASWRTSCWIERIALPSPSWDEEACSASVRTSSRCPGRSWPSARPKEAPRSPSRRLPRRSNSRRPP